MPTTSPVGASDDSSRRVKPATDERRRLAASEVARATRTTARRNMKAGDKVEIALPIVNTNRTVGTILSHNVVKQWGEDAQAAERMAKRKRAFLTAIEFTRTAS